MDDGNFSSMKIQNVLFGYQDMRTLESAQFGFAFCVDGSVVFAAQRSDVDILGLPETFCMTAQNLGRMIIASSNTPNKITDFHKHLVENVFNGVGSFRLWQDAPVIIQKDELDQFIETCKKKVNDSMSAQVSSLEKYREQWNVFDKNLISVK